MQGPEKTNQKSPIPVSLPRSGKRVADAAGDRLGARPRWRRVTSWAWRWAKRALVTLLLAGVAAVVAVVLAIRHYEGGLPTVSELQGNYRPPQVTRVLARDGTLLTELYTERRTVVPIETLPARVKIAVIAAEDAHFYEHEGLNYLGMLRALVVNLRSGRTRQGASTITQQVVKNLLLDPERSYRRKTREVILAKRLEQELSKEKILELYLNHIYFGHGRYGIEEAARFYFGSSARDVTLSQAALLAGLIASPELNSPRHNMDRAAARRRFVLNQMRDKGFITAEQYDQALREPIGIAPAVEAQAGLAPEAVEIAKRALRRALGDAAALGGYTVVTTIDPRMQESARRAVRENLTAYDKRHGLQAPYSVGSASMRKGRSTRIAIKPFEGTPRFAEHKIYVGEVAGHDDGAGLLLVRVGTVQGSVRLSDYGRYNPKGLVPSEFAPKGALLRVSLLAPEPESPAAPQAPQVPLRIESGPESALIAIEVRTREVLALVGNYEAIAGGLDRATQAKRQPGSTFKPIVYSYALHTRRLTAATMVETRSSTLSGYRPMNFEEIDGHRPVRLREALAQSINVAAVHVAQQVGPDNIVGWAHSLGIASHLGADLSLALGAYEVSPIEITNAYATFAAGGVVDTPKFILRIHDASGRDVPLGPAPPARRVLEEDEAFLITNLLSSVIDHGTGAKAKSLNRPLAGKTGTSNDAKDAWFLGFSTEIACGVWVGFDDAVPLGAREAGSTAALPAWIGLMRAAHEGRPVTDFARPSDTVALPIDPATGLRAYSGQQDALIEYFLPGTEPTEMAVPDAGVEQEDAGMQDSAMAEPLDAALVLPKAGRDAGALPALPAPDNPVPLF